MTRSSRVRGLLATLLVAFPSLAQTPSPTSTRRAGVARPTAPVPRTGCVTAECHPDIKRYPKVHGPVNVDACDACHKEADASRHTFTPTRQAEQLCTFCHQLAPDDKYVHQPVAQGRCTQCHNPHGGQERFLLKGGSGAASCAECHKDVTGGLQYVHGPVAAGACTACHRPHSSPHPKLLVQTGRTLCLECHVSLQKKLEEVRTVHGPAAVDCSACHLPHASARKMMLKQDTTDLCLTCHTQIKDLIGKSTTKHDAVSTGEACRNCHDPHGSDYSALLINSMVPLCLSCHDKPMKLPDGTTLAGMKEVLASGKSLHGPVAQNDCVPCHQIHGGSNFRLLVKEYPPEFYAPFREEDYALCFSCHNKMLVHDEKTTSLTDFRNGDVNMHYLHVNKKTKGRTCRACHETHASNKEKHIRDSVPFGTGGWELPINYEKTETGGRCSPGCHRPYGYDRLKPVQNLPGPTPATWPGNAGAAASRPEGGKP